MSVCVECLSKICRTLNLNVDVCVEHLTQKCVFVKKLTRIYLRDVLESKVSVCVERLTKKMYVFMKWLTLMFLYGMLNLNMSVCVEHLTQKCLSVWNT